MPGTLSRLTSILDNEDITSKAMLAASTAESSTARLVVNDPERAAAILKTFNFDYELSPVLAAEVPLHPGGIKAILPHVDRFLPVHNLDSLAQLVRVLADHAPRSLR